MDQTIIILIIIIVVVIILVVMSRNSTRSGFPVTGRKKTNTFRRRRRRRGWRWKHGSDGYSSDSDSDGENCKHLPKDCGDEGQIPQITDGAVSWVDYPEGPQPGPCFKFPETCGVQGQVLEVVGGVPTWVEKCDCNPPSSGGATFVASAEYPSIGDVAFNPDGRPFWSINNPQTKALDNWTSASGSGINQSTGIFTVPSDGIYFISGYCTWVDYNKVFPGNEVPYSGPMAFYLSVNGTVVKYDEDLGIETSPALGAGPFVTFGPEKADRLSQNVDAMLALQTGDQVSLTAFMDLHFTHPSGEVFMESGKFEIFKL